MSPHEDLVAAYRDQQWSVIDELRWQIQQDPELREQVVAGLEEIAGAGVSEDAYAALRAMLHFPEDVEGPLLARILERRFSEAHLTSLALSAAAGRESIEVWVLLKLLGRILTQPDLAVKLHAKAVIDHHEYFQMLTRRIFRHVHAVV